MISQIDPFLYGHLLPLPGFVEETLFGDPIELADKLFGIAGQGSENVLPTCHNGLKDLLVVGAFAKEGLCAFQIPSLEFEGGYLITVSHAGLSAQRGIIVILVSGVDGGAGKGSIPKVACFGHLDHEESGADFEIFRDVASVGVGTPDLEALVAMEKEAPVFLAEYEAI